jgi:hypothetical protein
VKTGEKTGISCLLLSTKDNYCKHSGDKKKSENKQSPPWKCPIFLRRVLIFFFPIANLDTLNILA